MIPRLDQLEGQTALYEEFLAALPGAGFGGEVRRDLGTRLVTATDNSVYQILPQAVVYPRTTDDVAALLALTAQPRFQTVTCTPRGGGTGTNGQSLSEGVIVDLSRHMNHILEVDLEGMRVRVQPGVVLDQLNDHLEAEGVFFAPNLSPSSRATLGGMIATDACGKGSRVYGRTSQHVLELTTVLADGTVWRSSPLDEAGLQRARAEPGRAGEIHRVIDDLTTEHQALIAARFPKLQRFMTGYNLARVARTEDVRFNLSNLICGAEGTLGVVTEAWLRLSPIPTCSELVILRYQSFDDALGSAQLVAASDPSAIETIDETVLGLARGDLIWHAVGPLLDVEGQPAPAAINLVEYAGSDPAAVRKKVDALLARVEASQGEAHAPSGALVAADAAQRKALWDLRKKGVGLLGNTPGERKPIAFVEDTVVPPERLAEYVQGFRAILDAAGLRYGMFGHVDVGCLHVRPALDLKDPADEARLRKVSDQVAALCQSHGGMMWGEHGKGFRSEYNPGVFGAELFEVLCQIKAAFDPHNQLNPGKLAVPAGSGASLVSVDGPKRGAQDRQIPAPARKAFTLALDCNGNGACYSWDPDHVMCPSSKVTRDRVHSPKGRAGVLREWLRQLAQTGYDPVGGLRSAPSALTAPLRWLARAWHTALGRTDYSHEVAGAMAGCLACKACATQCPIHVDVPRFRSDFLALYHTRYLRPPRDFFVGVLESVLPLMARAPRLMNALQGRGPGRWLVERAVGLVDTPPLAVPTARAGLRARAVKPFEPARLSQLSPEERARTVALVPDAFTTFYEPQVLLAAVDLVRALGFNAEVMPYEPSGKGLHVKGFLHAFRRRSVRNQRRLAEVAALGIPLIGLDPAVVLMFRDELPLALGTGDSGFRVLLLQEWLIQQREALRRLAPADGGQPYQLFGHCTERTAEPTSEARWGAIFEAAGLKLRGVGVGCCGMCGAFGHEAVHREESKGIFEMSWGRRMPKAPDARTRVLATGHSCRSQVKRFAGFRPPHPIEILAHELQDRVDGGGAGGVVGVVEEAVGGSVEAVQV